MASSPITSWQIDGEEMETVRDFISLGSKITTDSDCSHEIERRLLHERKAMTNLDSILKSRDIILPTKICIVKAMFFPVVTSVHGYWKNHSSDYTDLVDKVKPLQEPIHWKTLDFNPTLENFNPKCVK